MIYLNGKRYYNVNEWASILNKKYGKFGVDVKPNNVHQLFHHYGFKPIKTNGKREISKTGAISNYSEKAFYSFCHKLGFNQTLYNICEFGDADGEEKILKKHEDEDIQYEPNYKNFENDMEKHSKWLETMYQTEGIKKVIISESSFKRLFEDVYVSGFDSNKKNAKLTYAKSNGKRTFGKVLNNDYLKTDKMDQENHDTYEVPLKGGIMSYNITSIRGTEVMHYFKNKMRKLRTTISIEDEKHNKSDYELMMEDSEFLSFKKQFIHKISNIINWKLQQFKESNGNKISQISILPVPSSSNFNKCMADSIAHDVICGLPIHVVDKNFISKNTDNIQKDEDFIKKNQEYYNQKALVSDISSYTHLQNVNTASNKLKSFTELKPYVDKSNMIVKKILEFYQNHKVELNNEENTEYKIKLATQLRNLIDDYLNAVEDMFNYKIYYENETTNKLTHNTTAKPEKLKYTKGPSVEGRTDKIINILMGADLIKTRTINKLKKYGLQKWQITNFQIKNYPNSVRMALKNFYKVNQNDEKLFNNEIEEINKSVVVVFDDNISGGATLSDICLQLKEIGVDDIIPITFGEMSKQYNMGILQFTKPQGGFNLN